jgi:hypothetical protein
MSIYDFDGGLRSDVPEAAIGKLNLHVLAVDAAWFG